MMNAETIESPMGRPKSAPKTRNVKITEDAHEAARIASGYTGETFVEYVSRIITREGNKDIQLHHAERNAKAVRETDGNPENK